MKLSLTTVPALFCSGRRVWAVSAAKPGVTPNTLVTTTSERLANKDILALTSAGLGDDVILAKIKTSQTSFDTTIDELIELRKAGVSDEVIAAMIGASNGVRPWPMNHSAAAEPNNSEGSPEKKDCATVANKLNQMPGETLAAKIRAAKPGSFGAVDDARLEKMFLNDFPCLRR